MAGTWANNLAESISRFHVMRSIYITCIGPPDMEWDETEFDGFSAMCWKRSSQYKKGSWLKSHYDGDIIN